MCICMKTGTNTNYANQLWIVLEDTVAHSCQPNGPVSVTPTPAPAPTIIEMQLMTSSLIPSVAVPTTALIRHLTRISPAYRQTRERTSSKCSVLCLRRTLAGRHDNRCPSWVTKIQLWKKWRPSTLFGEWACAISDGHSGTCCVCLNQQVWLCLVERILLLGRRKPWECTKVRSHVHSCLFASVP